jgi:hypothetical protein
MTAAARIADTMSFSGYTWLSITVVGRCGRGVVLMGYWSMSTAFSSGLMRLTGAPSQACSCRAGLHVNDRVPWQDQCQS